MLQLLTFRYSFAVSGVHIFITDSIHEIRLTFEETNYIDTLLKHYDIRHGETDEDVDPIIASIALDGMQLDSIGVKFKSNFSYTIPSNKKPVKLDFNAFVKGKKLDGLTALNLSNEFPDPSMLRNTVVYKILREAGVVAPRTSFAKVFMNGVYYGLYTIIEQVDKTFITDHFHREGAELVKALSSPLYYNDDDTMSYYSTFQVKVRDTPESWSHLIALGRKVHHTPAELFADSMKDVFDLDSYIKVLAADIVFNNWDSYFYGQNYYLLRDSVKGKYFFIPWDYNMALNVYDVSGGNFDILPGGDDNHLFDLPLPEKILANVQLKKRYLDELKNINALMLKQTDFISAMHKKLRSALRSDTMKVFSDTQYDNCMWKEVEISEIPMKGLMQFIVSRNAQVKQLLK